MKKKTTPLSYGKISNVNTLRGLRMDPKYQEEQEVWLVEQKRTDTTKPVTIAENTFANLEQTLQQLPIRERLQTISMWTSSWLATKQKQHVTLTVDDMMTLLQLLENTGERLSDEVIVQQTALLLGVLRRLIRNA